jgi:signal peptidase I
LGHAYNTRPHAAFGWLSVITLLWAFVLVGLQFAYANIWAFYIVWAAQFVVLIAYLVNVMHAGVGAWRIETAMLQRYNRVWLYVGAILIWGIVFLSVAALLQSRTAKYNIPSGSMIPTLLIGDRLVAERDYFVDHAPQRGDVAIFKHPSDNKTDYIHRVVGLPGDTVQMIGGRLHINGKIVEREQIDDRIDRYGGREIRILQYIETLPGNRQHRIMEERGDDGRLDNTPVYQVPADHYFVLGDNRDNAMDSRVQNETGFIPRANIRDRPTFIFWHSDTSRIGQRIE